MESNNNILLYDKARPQVAMETQNTIFELGWEVMPHSAYSPDLAPSNYHMFCLLEYSLSEQSFTSRQELKISSYLFLRPNQYHSTGMYLRLTYKMAKGHRL